MNLITNWNELPIGLNAKQVSKILGLSLPLVYELFNRSDFPVIKLSEKRKMVPKDKLKAWIDKNLKSESNLK